MELDGIYFGGNVGYSWGRATTDFAETSTVTSVVTATTTGNPPKPLPGDGLVAVFTSSAAGSAAADMPGWLGRVQADTISNTIGGFSVSRPTPS